MQVINIKTSNKLANMSFVCSLLVVLVHIWHPKVGSASWWVYELTSYREIAVPFFFCASGYLLAGHIGEVNWWRKEFSKRVRSLVVPYVVWSVLWLIAASLWCVVMRYVFHDSRTLPDWVDFSSLFGWNPFLPPSPEHLWYLRSLVILIIASPLLVAILKWNPYVVLGLLLANVFFYRGNTYDTWGYLIDRTLACGFLFYFLLGVALRREYIKVKFFIKPAANLGIALFLWFACHMLAVVGSWTCVQLPLSQLSTLVWLCYFWQVIPSVRWPEGLTSLAFPIYMSHWTFVVLFVNSFFSNATPTALMLKAAVALIGSLFVAFVLKKVSCGYTKILFGGR